MRPPATVEPAPLIAGRRGSPPLWKVAACLVWLGGLGVWTGCSLFEPWQQYHHRTPFNEAELAPYALDGTAVIKGDAVLAFKDGKTTKASQEFVYLIPATAYTREWFEQAILAGKNIDGLDPRSLRVTRTTTTNNEGRFTFINLPPGEYYLICTIQREIPSLNIRSMEVKRGVARTLAHATVRVGPDEQATVHVTGQAS
jgi:hypothetical protein